MPGRRPRSRRAPRAASARQRALSTRCSRRATADDPALATRAAAPPRPPPRPPPPAPPPRPPPAPPHRRPPPPQRGDPAHGQGRARGRAARRSSGAHGERPPAVSFDPRLIPARPDLAARHLQGKVEAARFVDRQRRQVIDAQAPVRHAPATAATLATEAPMGEAVTIY